MTIREINRTISTANFATYTIGISCYYMDCEVYFK